MVALLERPVLVGSQVPRVRVVPSGVDHPKWDEIVDFVSRLGVALDEWQWDVLRVALMRSEDLSRWAAFTVGVCCPRQNGKNAILEIRELLGPTILDEKLLIHTAHLADTSKEGFRRLDDLIDANAWLSAQVKHIWRTNGHESIEFHNGNRIRFRTRTRGGGRGFSGSPVFFDEPMFLSEISMGSILPVMSAQPDPQAWFTGSAVDQEIHEDGVVFARVRDRVLSGDHSRLAYFEWSLDFESPDEVEDSVMEDPAAAASTNPAYGVRISPDYVEAEMRELDSRTLAVERYGVGDWPPVDGSASQVIKVALWDTLADMAGVMSSERCLAFDVSPDRSMGSIMAAGGRDDDLWQMEIIDHREGTGWIVPRLVELSEPGDVLAILVHGSSPAASLIQEGEDAGLVFEVVTDGDYAKACGALFDAVEQREFRHQGSRVMRSSIKGLTKRLLGDAWAWSRRNSKVDITMVVGGTLAGWGWKQSGGAADWTVY